MSLTEYAKKRDFRKTVEPKGVVDKGRANRFVIQKHAASHLHYDFRLEMDGVLKSWAVPKGVPFARGEKRLAMEVEDHPVSYINFEGTIPKGQYGGGTVMVWDRGYFVSQSPNPSRELKNGKLHFTLHGKKLEGEWYLVNMRHSRQWLLIKGGEGMKPISKKLDDTSAISGKSMAQLSANGAVWESKPRDTKPVMRKTSKPVPKAAKASTKKTMRAMFIEPMKARLVDTPPEDGGWIYEIKFDGFRAQAYKTTEGVSLLSRNEKDFAQKFPEVVNAISNLDAKEALIDGEIVALNKNGASSFQLLQAFELGEKRPPIYFYAFDLLRLNGRDLKNEPLAERKAQLEKILRGQDEVLRYSASLGEDARKLLKYAEKLGLEGLIGKQRESVYEPGRRGGAWIKLKLHTEQEFVIGGYTPPEGSRKYFGALLIGFYADKKLMFCGKVGTGFDTKLLKNLYDKFQKMRREDCPFANLPEPRGSRYSITMTATEMRKCHWLDQKLVCQVKFSEWTRDDKLRQPVFLGLREDKDAQDVVKEKAS